MIDATDDMTQMLPVAGPMRLQFSSQFNHAVHVFIIELRQDLLGDWIVTQSWTGKPAARGGGKITVVDDQEAGFKLLQKIARQKEKNGYRLI